MRFEWDAAKSEANLLERGFDFEFASLIFDGRTVEVEDHRKDYGEWRVIAIGLADGHPSDRRLYGPAEGGRRFSPPDHFSAQE